MIIVHKTNRANEHYVRLNTFKEALIDLLGLEIANKDLDEEQLLQLVKARIEDRNKSSE